MILRYSLLQLILLLLIASSCNSESINSKIIEIEDISSHAAGFWLNNFNAYDTIDKTLPERVFNELDNNAQKLNYYIVPGDERRGERTYLYFKFKYRDKYYMAKVFGTNLYEVSYLPLEPIPMTILTEGIHPFNDIDNNLKTIIYLISDTYQFVLHGSLWSCEMITLR